MAKDSQRLELEFIEKARAQTGKDIPEWMTIIAASGLDKQAVIHKWLRDEHNLNYMQATFLVGIYLNDGKPVYDYDVLFAKLFAGKEHLQPLYQTLAGALQTRLPEAEFIPTKAYVSIEGKRCFACATLTKTSIRFGLDLGALPFDGYTQKAKSLGAMPNLTHMIEITDAAQVDERLVGFAAQAYAEAHGPKA
jgi:hypothetical protein